MEYEVMFGWQTVFPLAISNEVEVQNICIFITWFSIVTSKKPFLIQLQSLCSIFNRLVQNKYSFFHKIDVDKQIGKSVEEKE